MDTNTPVASSDIDHVEENEDAENPTSKKSAESKPLILPEVHKIGRIATSSSSNGGASHQKKLTSEVISGVDKSKTWGEVLKPMEVRNNSAAAAIVDQPRKNKSLKSLESTALTIGKSQIRQKSPHNLMHDIKNQVIINQPKSNHSFSVSKNLLGKDGPHKYYEGNGDQFMRTREFPPLDEEGFAVFEPEFLGPDLCTIFRRMLNYRFRNKSGHILKPLEDLNMLCVRALPDIPVAIEFAKEVDQNARMRVRAFALCGEDMLPRYYAVEYTPPKIALLNCVCCMSCFRQPFNLAIFGLDGQLALRIVSTPLENCWLLRFSKECCCHQGVMKRMLIKTPDDAVIGSLVEFGHCFMTQWLQIHPGVPLTRGDLADAAVVQWQSKCSCMDSTMLYCGCKTDPDAEGAMIMADRDGRKYATARPWSGITSEDYPFLFSVRFTKNAPIEMKALGVAGSFIYNNLNWETRSDLTCCMLISCLFCTLRLWYDGGPINYDYDNWSNLPTRPATSYIPWLSINRPALVNYRRV